MTWQDSLDKKKGSRPRCVLLADGTREAVAERLTRLVGLSEVTVTPDSIWMPRGKPVQRTGGTWDTTPANEAILCKPNPVVRPEIQQQLGAWWLAVDNNSNAPNWDFSSTCVIAGQPGLLLIEAKAHQNELRNEEKGKQLKDDASEDSFQNHIKIGRALADASAHLQRTTGLSWAISRDNRYQMSNRFAWACKLAELGLPVILVYLGFLDAFEMAGKASDHFRDHEDWATRVRQHSDPLFPAEIWEKPLTAHGQPIIPLIRSVKIPFDGPCTEFKVLR